MILEGLVTTVNADGTVNIAPMGPTVDAQMQGLVLRPFPTSTTLANLTRTGVGVFHVTDDVELLAHAAIGRLEAMPALVPAGVVEGKILADACRWYAFRVRSIDDSGERVIIETEIVGRGVLRDFFGFNRAKHAVLEAAILATRVTLLPLDEIQAEFARLAALVYKTGGPQEHRAFLFLDDFLRAVINAETENTGAAASRSDL
ncbi:MAG: DUF447 domain-containing protein [Pirellulales bacterium]